VLELAPSKLHRTVAELSQKRSLLTADDTMDIHKPIGQTYREFAAVRERFVHLLPPIVDVCQPVWPQTVTR
jgi:hypothetical protein